MKANLKFSAIILIILSLLIAEPLDSFAKKNSFGGSRSRPSSSPSMNKPSGSFGGSRQSQPAMNQNTNRNTNVGTASSFGGTKATSSFSGKRMNSSSEYTNKYGTPRKTMTSRDNPNIQSNYVVNSYGGMSDGFMMGYLMGATPWYWSMPFHPAYYYSRPHYVQNPDGTVGVYPPTFSFMSLLTTLLVVGVIFFIIAYLIRRRIRQRRDAFEGGSFE